MNKARKTSHILNVFQYNETTGAVTLPGDLSLTTPASNDDSTKASTTAWVRTYVTGLSYLTAGSTSTSDIAEGSRLYYTDTRVGTYLTSNNYATQSYVGTQIANLVASAPTTLDTLNELATALGNDANFSTTITTSIGTKVPQARTLTINGTAYDLTADRSWTITSMIYPGAGIAVSTGTAWGTSITNNSTNWNTAYGWGNHASAGYLTSISSSNVTTALGYTPYNATNPSGYITGITSSNVTTALGFTPLSSSGDVTIAGYLTVNGAGTSSSIYMKDSDEGNREIHCNSNRIGFLTQAGAWGAWCDDSGNWNAANFSGSHSGTSSGTNTGDQTNISGKADGAFKLWAASHPNDYYMVNNWTGAHWQLTTNHGSPVRVGYADSAGSAGYSDAIYWNGNQRLYGGSDGTRNTGWAYHTDNGTGVHWPNNGWHLYPENANDFWWRSGNTTESTIHFSKGGNAGSYIHNASDHAIGFLTTGRGWSLRVDNAGGATVYGGLTVRNAIYLDANEDLYLNYNYGCSIVGVYASTRYQGIFSMGNSWKLARDGSTPGNLYGLAWSHPNAGGQAGYLSTHGLLVMENGTCNTALANGIWTRGDVTAYSDARVKDNVKVIENAVEKIKAIRGVTFTRNDRQDKTTRFAGVIAQEVLKVLPEVVTEDAIGTYSVAYGNLNALLIEAIKEQQKEIDELKTLINGLTK